MWAKLTKWYTQSMKEITEELQVDVQKGLSSQEAEQRLKKFGPNKFEEGRKTSIWRMIWDQINSILIWILIIAAIVSSFVGEITDAIIIFIVIVLNAVIGIVEESKAEKALEELKKISTPKAIVKRDGKVSEISSEELVPGDVVILDAGRFVPADLRLIETANLQIEESALTGESVPVDKNADWVANSEVPLGDQQNIAFMSTLTTYGRGTGVVVYTGMETEIGKIAKMLGGQEKEITPLQKKLNELGKILGIGAVVICIVMFFVGYFQGRNVLDMFLIAVSLAVAAIPEGMVAIVTIVLALGVQKMSKQHAIVRKLPAVETLGSVSVICSDKTGTLTQNKMTVTKVFIDGKYDDLSGIHLNTDVGYRFMRGMMLCNDATIDSGDPTEIALVAAGKQFDLSKEDLEQTYKRINEKPFDSDRKMMTTVHENEDSFFSITKGALESILPRTTTIIENGQARPLTKQDQENIMTASKKMSDTALRVLAIAERNPLPIQDMNGELEEHLTFLGLVGMIDPPREEVKHSIQQCKEAGIQTVMITGDHQNTALAIAKELGIADSLSQTLTGQELNELSDTDLKERVKTVRVFARVSPEHKVRIVKALKDNGQITSMTGDGINDAPSLKQADVGVAMGITGTDVAKGASDIILTDDNFSTIVAAVEQGRNIFQNIRKAILFLLSCNLGELTALFLGILLGWPAPLTAVQILWVNLITDTLPAIALGMDPDDPDVMKDKPRNPKESFFVHGNGAYTVLNGMLIGFITLFAFIEGLRYYTGASTLFTIDFENITNNALTHAQTMAFITLSVSQLFHTLNLRSRRKSIFQVGLFSNKLLIAAIVIGIFIQALLVYVPFFHDVFGIYVISAKDWVFVIGVSLIPIVINEIYKGIRRVD